MLPGRFSPAATAGRLKDLASARMRQALDAETRRQRERLTADTTPSPARAPPGDDDVNRNDPAAPGRGGWIGVQVIAVDKQLAAGLKLRNGTGVMVSDVDETGPAYRNGIISGDVIVSVGSVTVTTPRQFAELITRAAPNTPLMLTIVDEMGTRRLEFAVLRQPAR